ncbi:uncharacterized protein LOC106171865 [Lingula anatina]|uniref:Uncharacterized protein LOC106171865 n=1 Tax=Lingula anatina TaxID=7574 RepID=A0A1S3JCA2_LINAN|nr:uncharacterized protein LOC106171865 [Lingula anatina]|eukprot:XP_013407816.1 uncharacterized protein LOC106171865 [Lingula anatina]
MAEVSKISLFLWLVFFGMFLTDIVKTLDITPLTRSWAANVSSSDNETTKTGPHILKTNYRTDCCENGGICVLGSFCKCPKKYHGRYCQHKHRRRPCGDTEHREWEQVSCNMCYCYDGILTCLPQVYDDVENCDKTKTKIFIKDFRLEWREKRKELKAKGMWDSHKGRPKISAANNAKSFSKLLLAACIYFMCQML